jgi:hypothetical protein
MSPKVLRTPRRLTAEAPPPLSSVIIVLLNP